MSFSAENQIRAAFPNIQFELRPHPVEGRVPQLVVKSQHPTVTEPLKIDLDYHHGLYWVGGYFYDFLGPERVEHLIAFLGRFFAEEVDLMIGYQGEQAIFGGPSERDQRDQWQVSGDRIEFYSWHGKFDAVRRADCVTDAPAEHSS